MEELQSRLMQDQAVQIELQSLETAAGDQTKNLRLVETLSGFHARLPARAETLEVAERQTVLRQVLQGYFQYHSIPGNWARVKAFRNDVLQLWF